MGSAVFYLKVRTTHIDELENIYSFLFRFLEENENAYEFWQNNRKENPNFWDTFKIEYPITYGYLSGYTDVPLDTYNHNSLAGILGYTSNLDIHENLNKDDSELEITYSQEVWHHATWDPLIKMLTDKFECEADYLSDEYINPFDLLLN